MEIEVWFGQGDTRPVGPIEATFLAHEGDEVRFLITDAGWLDHVGWDEPVEFTYGRLPATYFVSYDAYAWCPKGEGPRPSKWW